MIKPNRLSHASGRWILWILAAWLVVPVYAFGDNIRPVYLEIEELSSGKIRVVWKIPRGQGLPPQPAAIFSGAISDSAATKKLQTNDAIITS